MVAIIMRSIASVINKLSCDLPEIRFVSGDTFLWSPNERTIYYEDSGDIASLLHEVAHAILGHSDYTKDIDLLKMERDAWEYASVTLASWYEVSINEDDVQDALDTYRNWLHARSTCPDCQSTGIQTAPNRYNCLACQTVWQANEARSCALRRYTLSSN